MTGSSSLAATPPAQGDDGPTAIRFDYQKLVNAAFALFVFSGSVVIVEPSPYDLLFFVAAPIWFLGGFTIHRSFILFAMLVVARMLVEFIVLVPYFDRPTFESTDPVTFQALSVYMAFSALFFALFFANRTEKRIELCLVAYTVGAVCASALAIAGYFDIAGLGEKFTRYGRAMGPFKDPNVYASFAFVGAVYLAQNLLLARARSIILSSVSLLVIVAGVFLAFSRGSWAATLIALALMVMSGYVTMEDRRRKRRIAMGALIAIGVMAAAVVLLVSHPDTRDFFFQRFSVTQDYDEGATGRFGNQARSIPMLLGSFWGFGPMQFVQIFDLEPHNTFIGAFANDGWPGGLLFIALTGTTVFIAVRLMLAPTPYRRQAQVIASSILALFLQCFQIDVDHWRHFFLLLGAVWGLEAARQKWEARRRTRADAQR